jgi:GntR family transcriptional regulator
MTEKGTMLAASLTLTVSIFFSFFLLTLGANCPSVIGHLKMLFQIDFKSGTPVYLQLVEQIRYASASGTLKNGEFLPPIRTLAEELRVNRNTVAKAYAELESQGVIHTVQGKGCFLSENNSPFKKQVREKLLLREVDSAVVTAHHLQVGRDEFLALVRERLDFFERKAGQNEKPKENP